MSKTKVRIPVTVIMANYNHARFIDTSLGGIFAQTEQPAEVIIIDDCSTDNSFEIISRWEEQYPDQIRFLKNEKNQGVLKTIQRGLEESTHGLLFFHSADDFIRPDCFERYYNALAETLEAPLACSIPSYFTDDTEVYSTMPPDWGNQARYIKPDELSALLKGRWIHGYAMIRKSGLLDAGGIDLKLDYSADWFWLLVMGARSGVYYIPDTLALNRQLPTSFLETGRKDTARTDKLFERLLSLVTSESFSDIYQFLAQSAGLTAAGPELAEYILKTPKWITPQVQALTHRNFYQLNLLYNQQEEESMKLRRNGEAIAAEKALISTFKERLPAIISQIASSGYQRLAIYGTGKHSELLLQEWIRLGGPAFARAIVSSQAASESFKGIRLNNIDDVDAKSLDAVLISSQSWEKEIFKTLKLRHPELPTFAIWNSECSTA